jgi:cytochrome c551/c552
MYHKHKICRYTIRCGCVLPSQTTTLSLTFLTSPYSHSRHVLDTRLSKLRQTSWQQIGSIMIAALSICLCAIVAWHSVQESNPYIAVVLGKTGDPVTGHAIFQINCSGCHGLDATGKVGPSLLEISKRKSPHSLIEQVISGNTPPMPQFQPSQQEMADLLSYLATL